MKSSTSQINGQETSGGQRLKAIREDAGRTQLWVELEAGLGTGYLQRLESGRVALPTRHTLDRILQALNASYNERQNVMQMFGYLTPTEIPGEEVRDWAANLAESQLREFPFPAYVLDCLHRLVVWNQAAQELLRSNIGPGSNTLRLDRSMLEEWFDDQSFIAGIAVDPEQFREALVIAFRYESRRFRDEQWSRQLVDNMREIPAFDRHWQRVDSGPAPLGAARALLPLRLRSQDGGILSFRLSSEPFVDDARFRVVYFFPDDAATLTAFVPE